MVRRKSERVLMNTKFATLGDHHLFVLSFPLLRWKAQFMDSGFPLSQPTFNRLQGTRVNICCEALRAARHGKLSLRLLQQSLFSSRFLSN